MIDKRYCMSSYLAFRYIEDENKNFYEGMFHKNFVPISEEQRISVKTAIDIDTEFKKTFKKLKEKKKEFCFQAEWILPFVLLICRDLMHIHFVL